jgi:tetratricopeptide (TPR) repeat protein
MPSVSVPIRTALATAAALALLTSCANLPFAPDRSARAPALTGFGRVAVPVTTEVAAARELFQQGVLQAYAFNEVEAVRLFKAALAQDPDCMLCAWGVAWQLGPNINNTGRDKMEEALRYIDLARRHMDTATPRERALLGALAVRYGHASAARETAPLTAEVCGTKGDEDDDKPDPLDVAYAQRMREIADMYPNDADILTLYAEAEMIATDAPSLWDKDGKPSGRIGEVTARVERLLPMNRDHTGLNHYMIHLADELPVATRAVAAADRLGQLAPSSPHLVHMPAHVYVRVGRYADATRINQKAVKADVDLADAQKAQGFSVSKDWRSHNLHFLWFASLMGGREEVALEAAREFGERVTKSESAFAEYVRSLALLSLVRLERWDRVLDEPQPKGDKGVAQAWYEYARGVAQARLGRVDAAQESLTRLQVAAATARKGNASNKSIHKAVRSMMDVAENGLKAEVALAQKRYDEALALQAKVVDAAAKLDAREPPALADGTKLTLGHMQAKAARWADAEKTYRQALAEQPGSGWALRGLVQALKAQGRSADADKYRLELDRSWSEASPHLRNSA